MVGRNRRLARIPDSDDEDGEFRSDQYEKASNNNSKKKAQPQVEESEDEEPEEEEEEDTPAEDAKPIGEVIKVSGKGRTKRSHYHAFEYDGNRFELEDSVLLTPEEPGQKPYVAIIKEITQDKDDSMMVLGQWFYRPEEAEKKGGGRWVGRDTRELFYSFHRDEVPAESVMHKCQAHFVPLHKQIPDRSVHPGFIVQKVYDTVEKKLWKLTDKDYEDGKQHEIDLLVQKTLAHLGELPDLPATEDTVVDSEEQIKDRRGLKRKEMAQLDVTRDDGASFRAEQPLLAETPGATEEDKIIAKFKVLTGESIRNKWLGKLLESIRSVCDPNEKGGDTGKGGPSGIDRNGSFKNSNFPDAAQLIVPKDSSVIPWPDAAVSAVVALEKAAHDAFDSKNYNQKMRQLQFNLKGNTRLVGRMINGELEASVVLHMSAVELKDGLTAQEMTPNEPEEAPRMQMTDARCNRCQEKNVGLTDIIQGGARGDRYNLECISCGHSWYASRDDMSTLTIDDPSSHGKNVGAAPLATTKFEDIEKKLVSPRDSEKPSPDIFRKTLDTQRSFKRPKPADDTPRENRAD
ncbi:hypothetical protein ACHQM5_008114 [Ranunculus cassubicifolius]